MKHFFALSAAALGLAGALQTPAVAQSETLIFNSYLPPMNSTRIVGVHEFGALIEEESGGDIAISIPDSSLAPSDQQYGMVVSGVADMAMVNTNNVLQYVTTSLLANIPGNSPTAEAASMALWDTYQEFPEAFDQLPNVVILGAVVLPGRQLVTFEQEIAGPEDLSSLKLWVANGPMTELVEGLDAVPDHTIYPKLFEAGQTGIIDGAVSSVGSAGPISSFINHYYTFDGGLGSMNLVAVIGKERWLGLTQDQRDAILRAAEGYGQRVGASMDADEIAESEILFERVTPAEAPQALVEAITPHLAKQEQEWIELAKADGIENAEEILAFYREALASYSAQ